MMNTPSSLPVVWTLADDRAGNVSQVVGVAQALALPTIQKNIRYTRYGKLFNSLRGRSLWGMDAKHSDPITPPWPDFVISAGRKTAPIARYIKKQSGNHTKLIHLMNPGFPCGDFDLIAIPTHDRLAMIPSMVQTVGAPHRITSTLLESARTRWEKEFSALPSPRISVLIGGTTKKGVFTDSMAEEFGHAISQAAAEAGGSLLITASRRTSATAAQKLKGTLSVPYFFYDPSSGLENPYLGLLAFADIIIASGDSISMCSEACFTGKPVYIYAPELLIPAKHQAFHRELYRLHHAQPFEHHLHPFEPVPLRNTEHLARIICERFEITPPQDRSCV